jgi:hypothetical protein
MITDVKEEIIVTHIQWIMIVIVAQDLQLFRKLFEEMVVQFIPRWSLAWEEAVLLGKGLKTPTIIQ